MHSRKHPVMVSKISNVMYGEHAIILEAIQIASSLDKSWETNSELYENNLKELLVFFKEYSDQYHHYKEEEILFPALLKMEEPSATAVINELLEHHEDFRALVGKIKTDLAGRKYPEAQQKIKEYSHDLLDHIAAENEELFPMADTILSESELENLYYRCIDIDNELGIERKDDLENFIKNFKFKLDETVK